MCHISGTVKHMIMISGTHNKMAQADIKNLISKEPYISETMIVFYGKFTPLILRFESKWA